MKLYNIKDLDRFLEVIDSCEGKVELVGEDIRLNLKSKLAQYFSLAKIFSNEEDVKIKELEIVCEDSRDTAILVNYMRNGLK